MKQPITNLPTKTFVAAVLAASISQVAHAGFTTNDLYLGFTQDSAQSDYIIDLGQPGAVGVSGTSVVTLSSYFSLSTFNSVFTTGVSGVNAAVVAGNNTFAQYDVYATQIRTNGPSNPAVAGSSVTAGHSSSQMSGGAAEVASILSGTVGGLPTVGNSVVDSTKSYSSVVMATGVQNNFIGKTGVNPAGTFDTSGILYLDLYKANVATPYTYLGFFTFNPSASTVTFTPSGAAATAPPPPPSKLTITRSGTSNNISFTTTNGATYQLIYTNAAGLQSARTKWPSLGNPITASTTSTNIVDVTTDPNRFYSIKAH